MVVKLAQPEERPRQDITRNLGRDRESVSFFARSRQEHTFKKEIDEENLD